MYFFGLEIELILGKNKKKKGRVGWVLIIVIDFYNVLNNW